MGIKESGGGSKRRAVVIPRRLEAGGNGNGDTK